MISNPGICSTSLKEKKEFSTVRDLANMLKTKKFGLILKKVGTAENSKNVLYCRKCNKFISGFGFHCHCCDVCIEVYYHHDFLINNCIGKSNVRSYLWYLFVAAFTYILLIFWVYQATRMNTDTIFFEMIAFMISMILSTYFVGSLIRQLYLIGSIGKHALLIEKNQEIGEQSNINFFRALFVFFFGSEKHESIDTNTTIKDQIMI